MTSETSSTVPSFNKSTAPLCESSTKKPLHFPTFEFPALKRESEFWGNMCAESLVDEALVMLDDMDLTDDAACATPAVKTHQEARRKELLLDNLESISQAVRLYRSGDIELDLDSDIDSDYEDDDD